MVAKIWLLFRQILTCGLGGHIVGQAKGSITHEQLPLSHVGLASTDRPSSPFACKDSLVYRNNPIDKHILDAFGILMGGCVRGKVPDRVKVDDSDVGKVPFSDPAPAFQVDFLRRG